MTTNNVNNCIDVLSFFNKSNSKVKNHVNASSITVKATAEIVYVKANESLTSKKCVHTWVIWWMDVRLNNFIIVSFDRDNWLK